jgi:beta-glucosidase
LQVKRMISQPLTFPDGFLWGTATSSHQVEGNNTNNDWWAFEQRPGAIWHGDRSGLACDWWRNAEVDLDLMASMGHNTHRLSVEWSRIEPEEGVFDPAAIARYRELLTGLRQRGMEPMVTLFHFSSPQWLFRRGGWRNPAVVGSFRRFARYCVEQLGDLVKLWCTINEPNVYAAIGYLLGMHSPGEKNPVHCFQVLNHQLQAHAAAYRVIKALDGGAQAGLVVNILIFEPLDQADRVANGAARLLDHLFHNLVFRPVGDGRMGFPLSLRPATHGPLVDSTDFWGVNHYTRLRTSTRWPFAQQTPGRAVSDSGHMGPYGEIYPEGMYRVLKRVAALGKPIYVTENGLPDADDDQRPRFLVTYLAEVQRAIAEGVDVRGYYHWSFIDNFEWSDGWDLRFGLVALEEKTQARTPRPSARLYSDIIRANAIMPAMMAAYAPEPDAWSASVTGNRDPHPLDAGKGR